MVKNIIPQTPKSPKKSSETKFSKRKVKETEDEHKSVDYSQKKRVIDEKEALSGVLPIYDTILYQKIIKKTKAFQKGEKTFENEENKRNWIQKLVEITAECFKLAIDDIRFCDEYMKCVNTFSDGEKIETLYLGLMLKDKFEGYGVMKRNCSEEVANESDEIKNHWSIRNVYEGVYRVGKRHDKEGKWYGFNGGYPFQASNFWYFGGYNMDYREGYGELYNHDYISHHYSDEQNQYGPIFKGYFEIDHENGHGKIFKAQKFEGKSWLVMEAEFSNGKPADGLMNIYGDFTMTAGFKCLQVSGYFDKEGKSTGNWSCYDIRGKLLRRVRIPKKKKDIGFVHGYHFNGQIALIGEIMNDLNIHSDISIVITNLFTNICGFGALFYQNGKLLYKGMHKDGNIDSENTKLYHDNGKLLFEGAYRNGKKQGPVREYHKNGNLHVEANCVDGMLNGHGIIYLPDGLMLYDGAFVDDAMTGYGRCYVGEQQLVYEGNQEKEFKHSFSK